MAFDFPNVPFIGQQVTGAGGIVYQWDGTKWVAAVPSTAYAPIDSPTFTGDPKGPTPATGDNDTSLATTAFVKNVIAASPPPGAIISATAPTGQNPGAMWWDTNGGQLYILYNDGNSTQWVAANNIGLSNVATQADVGKNTGRNLLHNSMFNVQQRGTGPFTGNGYTADRWANTISGGDTLATQIVVPQAGDVASIGDESCKWIMNTSTTGTSGGYAFVGQKIEDIKRLAGKTVIVSFYANSSAAQKIGINLLQDFGTGGSPSANLWLTATSITTAAGTAWARYSATFVVPSVAGKTLGTNGNSLTNLTFWLSSGAATATIAGNPGVQSGTINIWGVQLEIGSTATPLEKPDPQVDLANCRRFYQTCYAFAQLNAPAGSLGALGTLTPQMRASPTVTIAVNNSVNMSGFSVGAVSSTDNRGLGAYITGNVTTAGATTAISALLTASADL